jgi:YidC/Oxa1 family membrane protein insertase
MAKNNDLCFAHNDVVFFNSYGAGLSLYNFISNLITIGIMIVIKRYFIDSDKIHAQIQENKLKEPKKQGKFRKTYKKDGTSKC